MGKDKVRRERDRKDNRGIKGRVKIGGQEYEMEKRIHGENANVYKGEG